jgi:hypothetical protein
MRARIVVLTLLTMTPFLASYSQARGTKKESARRETSAKPQKETEKVKQQGQHKDNDTECPADAKSSSKGQNQQQGQHDDAKCTATPVSQPPAPVPVVGIAQIHGMVFNDLNGNGLLDFNEYGLAGWTLTLSGPVSATAVTLWDGSYEFLTLPVGTYTVCAAQQTSWVATAPKTGPCAGGFGWSLDVPATMPDLWYGAIDFGVKGI